MEQEEDSTPGVIRKVFLRSHSIPLLLIFLVMENPEEKESKKSQDMLSMCTLS